MTNLEITNQEQSIIIDKNVILQNNGSEIIYLSNTAGKKLTDMFRLLPSQSINLFCKEESKGYYMRVSEFDKKGKLMVLDIGH